MLNRVALAAVVVTCIIGYGGSASSDDGAMSAIGGGAVRPMGRHPSVRMVKERVTAQLTPETAHVRCEFVFKNEGKATTVTMGFPEKAWSSGDGSANHRLEGFKSWVDGRPVKTRYMPSKRNKPRAGSDAENYDAWYVKKVSFKAGQTRTVIDEYSSDLGGDGDSSGYSASLFDYILKTGRNWKGSIGEAIIVTDVSRLPRTYYDIAASPKDFRHQTHTLTWTMKNFEPKEDIEVTITPRYPILNGRSITGWMWEPFTVVNGRAMTGLMFLRDLGASVEWDKATRSRVIKYGKQTLMLKTGSRTAKLNGSRTVYLPVAPKAVYDRCSVPISPVVRALGGKVRYDWKTRRLNLWLPAVGKPRQY